MFLILVSLAFAKKYERYAAFGEALQHARDVIHGAPERARLKASVQSYTPTTVKAGKSFRLTLSVSEAWPTWFRFRIDSSHFFDGELDAMNRPTALISGLRKGERLLYVSFDGETWMYLGQIKVERGTPWFVIFAVLVCVVAFLARKYLVLRRRRRFLP